MSEVPEDVVRRMVTAYKTEFERLYGHDKNFDNDWIRPHAMRAALSVLTESGWMVVPVQPTNAMIDSGVMQCRTAEHLDDEVEWIWAAMLAASPSNTETNKATLPQPPSLPSKEP